MLGEMGERLLFGGYIVGYLFFAGAGAGAFLVAAVSCIWDALRQTDRSERLACAGQRGFMVAPCAVGVACVLLVADVGATDRLWVVFANPFQSVMSFGAWTVAALFAVSVALAAASLLLARVPRALQWAGCLIGSLLAVGTMTYTGVLLADMVSIDFWHTGLLVALFVTSSLSCGTAGVIATCAVALPRGAVAARDLWRVALLLGVVEACVLVAFLASRYGVSETARASCGLLLSGSLALPFWGGVAGVGLAVPFAAHARSSVRTQPSAPRMAFASACVLAGGVALRFCVVAAALYTPLTLGVI